MEKIDMCRICSEKFEAGNVKEAEYYCNECYAFK
jgi:hypothetical protein